jgi:hypothetical protein
LLIREQAVLEMVAKTALHPMHAGFREAATMVTDTLLPLSPATAADLANRHVPGQRAALRVTVLLDLRVAWGGIIAWVRRFSKSTYTFHLS